MASTFADFLGAIGSASKLVPGEIHFAIVVVPTRCRPDIPTPCEILPSCWRTNVRLRQQAVGGVETRDTGIDNGHGAYNSILFRLALRDLVFRFQPGQPVEYPAQLLLPACVVLKIEYFTIVREERQRRVHVAAVHRVHPGFHPGGGIRHRGGRHGGGCWWYRRGRRWQGCRRRRRGRHAAGGDQQTDGGNDERLQHLPFMGAPPWFDRASNA